MKLFQKSKNGSPEHADLEVLQDTIDKAHLPPYVKHTAQSELAKMTKTHPSTAEYTIALNYLDYLLHLPWTSCTEDNLDIMRAEACLNEDHFGLDEVKERILEYLAVGTLKAAHKIHILVVDDEEIARQNLKHVLEKDNYAVQTAVSGEEALALLEQTEFDVVITDLRMGRVDGVQVLERAKQRNSETEVVMITAYATVDSAVEAMKKGAFHYLAKPYKLEDVRDTINQILELKRVTSRNSGPVLCLVGPPGTGKTSLARSVARALERKFIRLSLAGMKDEAELRGHRRTYAGAMPGRIIQEIRRVGVNNPVFLLDEIDKAVQDFKGNPTAPLLEVLDPEQNKSFIDNYLDLSFDLSRVMFITTANIVDPIPRALLDRMEVHYLNGYTDVEKEKIAFKYIIPNQIKENALQDFPPKFTPEAVLKIIREYTREAGLRNLEREVARICRRIARESLAGDFKKQPVLITPEKVEKYLGPRRYYHEVADTVDRVGVATGMFWTENGGEIVFIEATIMRGKSDLILTGSLGEVMQESAQAALSYIRANTEKFNLFDDFFNKQDIHIHIPSAAIPKDGPSAGLTIAIALLSLLTDRPARRDVAFTGELTLSGRLLPVGGIREKILAAGRAGVKTVVLPEKNRANFQDLPDEAHQGLEVVFASTLEDIVNMALLPAS